MLQNNKQTKDELKRKTLVAEEMYRLACSVYTPLTYRIAAAGASAILVQLIL